MMGNDIPVSAGSEETKGVDTICRQEVPGGHNHSRATLRGLTAHYRVRTGNNLCKFAEYYIQFREYHYKIG